MSLTNDDLVKIKSIVDGAKEEIKERLATKADKSDVDRMESRVVAAIGLVERDGGARLDDLEVRVGRLERAA